MLSEAGEKGRPAPRRRLEPGPAGWLLAGAVLLGACSSTTTAARGAGSTAVGSAVPTTTTVPAATTRPAPTSTVYHASAPQPSLELAAGHLISSWRAGDRAGALTAATPAAVEALFAQPYPPGGAQPRGCSEAVAGPSSCDYRVNNGLLKLSALAVGGGWTVEGATFES